MPPFLPRKRLRLDTPPPDPPKSKGKGKAVASINPRKPTLFDALDAGTSSGQSTSRARSFLARLEGSDCEDSELSSLSSSELDFEDVPVAKRQKTHQEEASSEEDDEDIEFEDVKAPVVQVSPAPPPSGDLDLTLTKENRISLVNPHNKKQGPSKIERQIRVSTHCMHVQFLLWHNWIRNGWISDKEVQQILVNQLGPNIQKEIQRWKVDSGVSLKEVVKAGAKPKEMKTKGKKVDERSQRDWGEPAQRLSAGGVNMSHGDPVFKLMRALSAYWKKRFRIATPGLRKIGYMPLSLLDEELKSFNKDTHDPERHGERVHDLEEFRVMARRCEGSRDLSAQLFAALLRGIGLEARMVVSLQPVGFGWSKTEDAVERPSKRSDKIDHEHDQAESEGNITYAQRPSALKRGNKVGPKRLPNANMGETTRRKPRGKGLKDEPIDVSDSEAAAADDDADDDSVIDVTPAMPRRRPSKIYEKDLPPNYWVEVLSPVTNTYYAVNPSNVNSPVATNAELLAAFEPRGAKSEKAKQVMAYIVGFSPDGTAKDVTVRYIKRHMWPGKTKGFRMPIEKIPVYNHRGKIKRHEEFDWFKTVISRYLRGNGKRTEVDEHEEATDLRAIKPEKKEVKDGEETLQSYKSSTEFVLERHLRREEALLPTATQAKTFLVKGKKGEIATEEKVFLRKDVFHCKSVETWHKEGREPRLGEQPLKRVPYRAATTNRKRELAEAEAASGEKMLQGLYSWDQTDWIIPPPIVDGKIPKNGYGNIDVYVPSMVPVGAVHLPYRRTKEICRKLGIDYAEAVTGFEFGARMAIPVITGVVIAEENEEMVLEQWEKDEAERARKEDEKRTKAALGMWRKFLMGLRIVERVREEYGDKPDNDVDILNPWVNKNTKKTKKNAEKIEEAQRRITDQLDEDMAGGFLPEGHHEEEIPQSFFPTRHEEDDGDGGGFVVEGDEPIDRHLKGIGAYPTPISVESNKRAQLDPSDDSMEEDDEAQQIPSLQRKRAPSGSSGKLSMKQSQSNTQTVRGNKASSSRRTARKVGVLKAKGKRKQPISSDDDQEPGEINVTPEEEESVPDTPLAFEEESTPRPKSKRGVTLLPKPSTQSPRTVPKRKAARKSETALKSHYFIHSGDEDDE